MTQTSQHISPLRQRMVDDMRMRKLSPQTQSGYIRAVEKLAGYLGHSPDTATAEELRQFQLHLVNHGVSGITLNATITAPKLYSVPFHPYLHTQFSDTRVQFPVESNGSADILEVIRYC
jgi:hypothetical protein